MYASVCACVRECVCACVRACMPVCLWLCMQACVCVHVHAYKCAISLVHVRVHKCALLQETGEENKLSVSVENLVTEFDIFFRRPPK